MVVVVARVVIVVMMVRVVDMLMMSILRMLMMMVPGANMCLGQDHNYEVGEQQREAIDERVNGEIECAEREDAENRQAVGSVFKQNEPTSYRI